MDSFKQYQKDTGISKHLPITHLNSPSVFETIDGQMGMVLRLQGISFDTETAEQLNYMRNLWHQALVALGPAFCLYNYIIRRQVQMDFEGQFSDSFSQQVNDRYHRQFKDRGLYQNQLYVVLLYRGVSLSSMNKVLGVLDKLRHRAVSQQYQQHRQHVLQVLDKAAQQFIASLSAFRPYVLGSRDRELGYAELLQFFATFVNGLSCDMPIRQPYPVIMSVPGMHIGKSGNHYPRANLAYPLSRCRLFFGQAIEFQQPLASSRFALILSIKDYASETTPIVLDKLLQLDGEFILTNSFAAELTDTAQQKIMRHLVRMQNANDAAFSQISALSQCQDDLASERLQVGYHHHSMMIVSDSLAQLNVLTRKAVKFYADVGFAAIIETLGQEACFWAQIPGNQRYIARSTLLTSQNYVDCCSLHNYHLGYCDGNHLGKAVTLIETPSRTPLFFNYHSEGSGSKNDLTPGHTTIIGGNGSGKTVFMGFMDSQMGRYGGKSFFFDRDRGLEIYIRATGGQYTIIQPGAADDCQLNPFCLLDTPENRAFLKQWLMHLVKSDSGLDWTAEIAISLSECVDYAYDVLAPEQRCLRHAIRLLPVDSPCWPTLRKWLKDTRGNGEYAYLFDHQQDHFNAERDKVGFDFTHLLSQPRYVLTAVAMYLLHCIKQNLNGQRVSIYFDEGWQFLDHPYWKEQLQQDLPTLRKLNAHIVLATQSPASVLNSAVSAQFLDNCATNIFFCNAKADFEKHYQHFNVSRSEFAFIKNTPAHKRLFLYKQSQVSAVCALNLSELHQELAVYSANRQTV